MLTLILKPNGQPERRIPIDGDRVVIGRGPDCDVVIDDLHVSNHHLKILSGLAVVDLESRNGTFIDGDRITEATLIDGQTVRLGDTELRLEVTDDAASTEASKGSLLSRWRRNGATRESVEEKQAEIDALNERVRALEEHVVRLRARLGKTRGSGTIELPLGRRRHAEGM